MAHEDELVVSQLLWEKLPVDLRDPGSDDARRTLVLAAYLDLLSQEHGLSDRHEAEAGKRAQRPTPFLPLVGFYLADGKPDLDIEHVRDVLYRAVAEFADLEASPRLLTYAQIYWAMSQHASTRPLLPYPPGGYTEGFDDLGRPGGVQIAIWIEATGKDAADLKRSPRSEQVKHTGLSSGAGLRREGASLSVRVAQKLVAERLGGPTVDIAIRRLAADETGALAISWGASPAQFPAATGADDGRRAQRPAGHELIERAIRDLEASGLASEAALVLDALVQRVQQQAGSDPDHEESLAEKSLRAGLASQRASRPIVALEHLQTAETSGRALAELRPDEPIHRVRVAFALALRGVIYLDAGKADDAEQEVARAADLAQVLVDEGHDTEDVLVLTLSFLGIVRLLLERLDDATAALNRTITIATKLARRHPANWMPRLALINALMPLASAQIAADRLDHAERDLERAAVVAEELVVGLPQEFGVKVALATIVHLRGTVALLTDREDEGRQLLERAIDIVDQVLGAEPPPPPSVEAAASSLLAPTLEMLALVYLEQGREAEANACRARRSELGGPTLLY